MKNVEKYEHWYWMGIIARDTNSVLKEQFDAWFKNWEHKETLNAKIKFYDKLLKGDNKK